jgi:hypothetical protein
VASEDDIVRHLISKHRPQAIIAVGSRADGLARPGSDWDLYLLLSPDPSAPRGPIPAPDSLDGELLDVALVRLPIAESEIAFLFGANLRNARILVDNERADAARLCEGAAALYARGRRLPPAEIERRRHELARNIARMQARADEPGPFFEAVAYVFYVAHRCWYEVLRDEWSFSVHRAMPEIERRDPAFHRRLVTLASSASPAERIDAADAIFRQLFAGSAEPGG